jgi:Ca2+:H+ antiporter
MSSQRSAESKAALPHPSAPPWWSWAAPLAALAVFGLSEHALHGAVPVALYGLSAVLLFAAVFAAVHHAETVAERIGQPFGSILLALAVTVIEVSLIVSMLLSSAGSESSIARDTVFAAIMIVLNGIVGLCLVIGGLRFHEQSVQPRGATAALGVLGTLAVLGLVLPNYTTTVPGPVYAPVQLVFVAVVSLALYGLYLYVQTVRHRDDFLEGAAGEERHHPPGTRSFVVALCLLPISLLSVVLLAEFLAHPVGDAITGSGFPEALIGVLIAMVVLMPEGVASMRAAAANRLQTSINLALGSALASLCLTIPTVAVVALVMGQTLVLGLEAEHLVLLILSLFMATLTLATGRTTVLQGGIHLVIFFAFLTISAIP